MRGRPSVAASVSSAGDESKTDAAGADKILYRFFVDSLTEYAVFAVSPTGIIISWNAAAAKTFGYGEAGIDGKPFDLIFTAADRAAKAADERQYFR